MCDLVIQMLWFFVTALLQVAIYSYTKFQVNILNTFEDTLLSKFDSENTKGEIIQNLRQTELWFLVIALLQVAIYLYSKFQVNMFNSFEDILRAKFDYKKNTKGEIIQNLRQTELWFFVNALLQVAIYLYFKFQVNTLNSFEDTLQTKFYCKNTKGEISLSPKLGQGEGQNGVG